MHDREPNNSQAGGVSGKGVSRKRRQSQGRLHQGKERTTVQELFHLTKRLNEEIARFGACSPKFDGHQLWKIGRLLQGSELGEARFCFCPALARAPGLVRVCNVFDSGSFLFDELSGICRGLAWQQPGPAMCAVAPAVRSAAALPQVHFKLPRSL